jgi:mono/diheme cytochrome c family protein
MRVCRAAPSPSSIAKSRETGPSACYVRGPLALGDALMSKPPPTSIVVAATAAFALVLGLFVFRPTSAKTVREWTPADHDQPEGAPAGKQAAPNPGGRAKQASGGSDLAELAWSKNCAMCHGPTGRGDGPQGPMVKAPDLTQAEWQGKVKDEDIARTIREGRGSMPKFDLPPNVVQGLVQRIRRHRAP